MKSLLKFKMVFKKIVDSLEGKPVLLQSVQLREIVLTSERSKIKLREFKLQTKNLKELNTKF